MSIGASPDDFTVPEVITLAMACIPAATWLSRALGVSRNSIVSPVGTRACRRTSSCFTPPHLVAKWGDKLLLGAKPCEHETLVYSWWCPSVNSFKFQPCDHRFYVDRSFDKKYIYNSFTYHTHLTQHGSATREYLYRNVNEL